MRVYCSTPLSSCPARTNRSPSALALFQSRGCARTSPGTRRWPRPPCPAAGPFRPASVPLRDRTAPQSSPSVQSIKQRRRPERPPVPCGIAEARHRREMVGGGISLVPVEAITGSAAWRTSIRRSRVTLATIDAAAIAAQRRSPPITPRCAISSAVDAEGVHEHAGPGCGASERTARAMALQRRSMDVVCGRSRWGPRTPTAQASGIGGRCRSCSRSRCGGGAAAFESARPGMWRSDRG